MSIDAASELCQGVMPEQRHFEPVQLQTLQALAMSEVQLGSVEPLSLNISHAIVRTGDSPPHLADEPKPGPQQPPSDETRRPPSPTRPPEAPRPKPVTEPK